MLLEIMRQFGRVQARQRDERHDAGHHQHARREQDARLQLRDLEAVKKGVVDIADHCSVPVPHQAFAGAAALRATTSHLPPFASIFALAEALNALALTVSFLESSPSPRILTPSARQLAKPIARNAVSSTFAPSSNW